MTHGWLLVMLSKEKFKTDSLWIMWAPTDEFIINYSVHELHAFKPVHNKSHIIDCTSFGLGLNKVFGLHHNM